MNKGGGDMTKTEEPEKFAVDPIGLRVGGTDEREPNVPRQPYAVQQTPPESASDWLDMVPWTRTPPTKPGLYWWQTDWTERPGQVVVVRFGESLCARYRWASGDSVRYANVETLDYQWAGPVPTPMGWDINSLEIG